jgi:hypothetical protein
MTASILYASLLGQSNVSQLSVRGPDGSSGVAHLKEGLIQKTSFSQVAITNSAVGSSTVDGNSHDRPLKTWWYPDDNKPGKNLLDAVATMNTQITNLRAQGSVIPIVVWGQGESEANSLGTPKTDAGRQAAEQRYLTATKSVFDYIQDHVNPDIEFYILETGRFNTAGAVNFGYPQYLIDKVNLGLKYVDDAQMKLAQLDPHFHFAVDYDDLPMFADMPRTSPGYESDWSTDSWHLSYPSKEIVGDRLAAYVAADLGSPSPTPTPTPSGSTLYGTSRDDVIYSSSDGNSVVYAGGGNDTVYGRGGGNTLYGGSGSDTLRSATGQNTLYGNDGNDKLYAGAGKDTLFGNNGNDTLITGSGSTYMSGGGGADIFKFLTAGSAADTIKDFQIGTGDKIDLTQILEAFDPISQSIADFVHATRTGANVMLSVDLQGDRHFADLVLLQGISTFDPETMFETGKLIA